MLGSLPLTSLAGESHLIDEAGYLTEDEVATLSAQWMSGKRIINVDVIVTVNALEGKTATAYADDYYDYNGFRPRWRFAFIEQRGGDFAVSTTGFGITAFTDYGLDKPAEKLLDYLRKDDYFKAEAFLQQKQITLLLRQKW